ncbi:UNVERIFIED_CONTAM: hypothetical protein K2H54_049491 [Gekko kuhli]
MGRTTHLKAKKNQGSPHPVSTYFSKEVTRMPSGRATTLTDKMADGTETTADSTLSRQEFLQVIHRLEENISSQIHSEIHTAIQPLTAELKVITETLTEVSQAAEDTLERAISAQEDIQHLYEADDWAKIKILMLENKMRDRNLKFCGIPETSENIKHDLLQPPSRSDPASRPSDPTHRWIRSKRSAPT